MRLHTHSSKRAARLNAKPWTIFIVIGLGNFLGPLSGSIVNVALPSIGEYFTTDVQSTKWVVLVYLMVSTFLLPIAGVWGQRYGEGRLYANGLIIYGLGSALCALTAYAAQPDLMLLVFARAIQACGSSLIFATGGALVTKYIPPERRGMAFGLIGSIVAAALISGPVIGGFICAFARWNWIFWLLLPVACLGYVASRLVLPPEGPEDSSIRLPVWSSFAWSTAIIGLTLIGEAFSKGLWIEHLWLIVLLTLGAAAWFVFTERRGPSLFDYSMFRIVTFRMATQGAIMVSVVISVSSLLIPFYLESYLGIPLTRIGLLLGMGPLCGFFIGPFAGHTSDRLGYKLPIMTGLSVLTAGYLLLMYSIAARSLPLLAVAFGLQGAGSSMYSGPNLAAMMSSVGLHQRPLASSIGSLTRNLGFLIGASAGSIGLGVYLAYYGAVHHITANLMQISRTQVLGPQSVPMAAFVFAFNNVLLWCAVISCIGLIISSGFPNRLSNQSPSAAPVNN